MKNILALIILLFLLSCENSLYENMEVERDLNIENNVYSLKEISKLVGIALNDKEVRKEVLDKTELIDSYGKSISLALLFEREEKISQYEKRKLDKLQINGKKSEKKNQFKEKILDIYNISRVDYPNIESQLKKVNSQSKKMDELIDLIIDYDYELFFPYLDDYEWYNLDSFTITYDNFNPDDIYEGFLINGVEFDYIYGIDEEYLFNNPTIAIIPIDNYYLGEDVLYRIGEDEYIISPEDPSGGYNVLPVQYSGNHQVPPISPKKQRLAYNVDPYQFSENHLLTTYIPKVRVTSTKWKRSLSKSLRVKIAKAGSEVSINPTGEITAIPGVFYFRFDISAKDLRNKRWKNVGILWEPNWHKTKNTQQMVLWTLRSNASVSTLDVNSKLNLDSNGHYNPSITLTSTHKVSSGNKAIFRGNKELDRVHTLTSIVNGAEFDLQTYNYDGINYSVRRINNLFEFFYIHDYTPF